jgi:hypothetical protein
VLLSQMLAVVQPNRHAPVIGLLEPGTESLHECLTSEAGLNTRVHHLNLAQAAGLGHHRAQAPTGLVTQGRRRLSHQR